MQPDDRIQIGVVGKPHGVRGGFHLDGSIDAPVLVPGFRLRVGDVDYTVASRGGTDGRPLVTLTEISDRDKINALRGQAVTAERSTLTPLSEGEWYGDDLVGLAVQSRVGAPLGTVKLLRNLPSVDVLDVEGADGSLMIPMIKDAIISISPEQGTVVVDAEFLDLG